MKIFVCLGYFVSSVKTIWQRVFCQGKIRAYKPVDDKELQDSDFNLEGIDL